MSSLVVSSTGTPRPLFPLMRLFVVFMFIGCKRRVLGVPNCWVG